MARSTLFYSVQRCSVCGYCASDVSRGSKTAARLIRTKRYQALLNDEAVPETARPFLCVALLQERGGRLADAGWSAVQAAWACDDSAASSGAGQCRMRAIDLFRRAIASGRIITDGRASDHAVITDLLRRSGRFDEALTECGLGLATSSQRVVSLVLQFERLLIENRDTGTHTIQEAEEANDSIPF